MITYQQARNLFSYNPVTGHLTSSSTGKRVGSIKYKRGRPACRIVRITKSQRMNEATVIWVWMTGVPPADEVDHKDLDSTNNKWLNLREANDTTNAFNRRKYGNSPYKWVQEVAMRNGPPRYRARVTAYGKRESSIYFDTPEEAHSAALVIAARIHGKYSRSI